ncbi:hypothetical protein HY500_01070 [Candidatus Woesearchaeota archaeon]|nr:hypothetical protein [Candidatus Woesearchaeota archaeon]
MYTGEFEELFRKISNLFTLETVSQEEQIKGKLLRRDPKTPVWDTLESIDGYDAIDIGGKYVSCEKFFRKPVRILFFILIHEIESRLYRIHRRNGKPLSDLDESNINNMIKGLISDKGLLEAQKIYQTRSELKEDLKAISSFRNIIFHTNRKLLKTVGSKTLIQRKKQVIKLLEALQQISDRMEVKAKDT